MLLITQSFRNTLSEGTTLRSYYIFYGGGWGETPPHDCKALWVYNNTQKALYKCIIHSFIHSFIMAALIFTSSQSQHPQRHVAAHCLRTLAFQMVGDLAGGTGAWGGDGSVGVVSGRGWRAWDRRRVENRKPPLSTSKGKAAASCWQQGWMMLSWMWCRVFHTLGGVWGARESCRGNESRGGWGSEARRGPVQCNAVRAGTDT